MILPARGERAGVIRGFVRAIGGLIVYEDGADPWCNTLLADRYPPCFAGLPPGIGVSVYLNTKDFPRWPKSKYLLMSASLQKLVPGRPTEGFLFPRGYYFPPGMARAILTESPGSGSNLANSVTAWAARARRSTRKRMRRATPDFMSR